MTDSSAQQNVQKKLDFKVSYKIALCFCSLVLCVLSVFWLIAQSELHKNLQQQADKLGFIIAEQTANSIRELVLANDLLSLNVVLGQLSQNNNIVNIAVFDIDGQLLTSSGPVAAPAANQGFDSSYLAPIVLQDTIAGSVQLQLDTSNVESSSQKIRLYFSLLLIFGLIAAITSAFILAAHFTTPLLDIIEILHSPDEKGIVVDEKRSDEISALQISCLELLERYKQNNADLRSLSGIRKVVTAGPETNPRANKIMASILVVKVVNINTAIELLHPSTLATLLSEYLFYLTQSGKLYGATLHRVTGESAMLAFDAGTSKEEHSFNAICCAQLFLLLMRKVSLIHRTKNSQALEFKLSIHSGDIFSAPDESCEIGKRAMLMGKTIETSYFLCKQSDSGQLLISETTYSQAGGEEKLITEGSTEITMPTDNMSFMAYILSPDMNTYTELLNKQSQHILPNLH
ncbi:hypothetical protein OAP18_00325 [Gammaproteobacteria bacterium]|nr:hypothetical protein [Gammaproteobacteria bacterium]